MLFWKKKTVEVSGASQVVKRVFERLGASEFLNR